MTSILKCFGARPGVNYVSVPTIDKLQRKVKDASLLGTPIILTDVDNMNDTLAARPHAYPARHVIHTCHAPSSRDYDDIL